MILPALRSLAHVLALCLAVAVAVLAIDQVLLQPVSHEEAPVLVTLAHS